MVSQLASAMTVPLTQKETQHQSKSIMFSSTPTLEDKEGYLSITLDGAASTLMQTGNPELPVYRATFMFSRYAQIEEVSCSFSEIKTQTIQKKIIPCPEAVPVDTIVSKSMPQPLENNTVYQSQEMYPGTWYSYDIKCGLNDNGVETTFVLVTIYPVQYTPTQNLITYRTNAKIDITYEEKQKTTSSTGSTYDMVIIAPRKFSSALKPLIDHKNNHGVKTILKTTETIYREYSGRDKPEKIKYFIKDAKEQWNVTYVLLVGGLKSYIDAKDKDDQNQGSRDWYVPVRYTNIPEDEGHGCISDLYYSDIYQYNKTSHAWEFEDWDSNHDNVFAEWSGTKRDSLDLIPDVYYGRLPCVTVKEVETVVNKIITYEQTSPAEKPWFRTMVGVGGKTFDLYNGQPDGEYVCDVSLNDMSSLIDNPVRLYASNRDTGGLVPVPKDIVQAISEGAGYVNFEGHGNPLVWDTIWADGTYPKDWAGGISVINFSQLLNGEKLPVVIVGGCHNALFNVSMVKAFRSGNLMLPNLAKLLFKNFPNLWARVNITLDKIITPEDWYWCYGEPAPRCFSWWLVALQKGGAIASTGCTGYGIGLQGEPVSLSSELETNFFYKVGQDGMTTLGSAHGGSITKFIEQEGIPTSTYAHVITVFELFGDPSLKLGGYGIT